MYIIGKKNKLGRKTFWYFFVTKNFFGVLLTLITSFTAYSIYAGGLNKFANTFLQKHIDYISTTMVSSWLFMLAGSLIIIILARTSVLYKQYSFVLHHHALHITQGIFFIKEQIIPYPQITNVEIISPYIYSLFGLVRLKIETGHSETPSLRNVKTKEIPPMNKRDAVDLAHELMRRAALANGYKVTPDSQENSRANKKRRRR